MKKFLKANLVSMLVVYAISLLIAFIASQFLKLDFLNLFIVVTTVDLFNFLKDYWQFKKNN